MLKRIHASAASEEPDITQLHTGIPFENMLELLGMFTEQPERSLCWALG